MKRFLQILILLVVMIVVTGALPRAAFAAESCATIDKKDMRKIKSQGYDQNDGQGNPTVFPSQITDQVKYTPFSIVFVGDFKSTDDYYLVFREDTFTASEEIARVKANSRSGTQLVFNLTDDAFENIDGNKTDAFIELWMGDDGDEKCEYRRYTINSVEENLTCQGINVTQNGKTGCYTPGDLNFEIAPLIIEGTKPTPYVYKKGKDVVTVLFRTYHPLNTMIFGSSGTFSMTQDDIKSDVFEYWNSTEPKFHGLVAGESTFFSLSDINAQAKEGNTFWVEVKVNYKKICNSDVIEIQSSCDESETTEVTTDFSTTTFITKNYAICDQIPESNSEARTLCGNCLDGKVEFTQPGIWTSLGCIPKSPTSMIKSLVYIGISLAGGVALIMILIASFTLSTSMGDPKKVTDAKEMLTSAIVGLLFIIFSVTILQFVGVSVLQIPGFGGA